VIYEVYLTPLNYVARTHLHRHRHGTWIHDKFLKLHTTRLLPWSVHATWSMKHDHFEVNPVADMYRSSTLA